MTLQELLTLMALLMGALLWGPVGWRFGWLAGVGAALAGAAAGLVLGFGYGEWLNRPQEPGRSLGVLFRNWIGFAILAPLFIAFIAVPMWLQSYLRAD